MEYSGLVVVFLACLMLALGQESSDNEVLTYTLEEEVTLAKYIGNVFEDAALASKYEPELLNLLQYEFINLPPEAEFLQIGEKDGKIRTKGRVDRDAICPRQQECVVSVDVVITPAEHIRFVSVQITIEDLNDNSPSFPLPTVTRKISESAKPGATISLPLASDPDSGRFGVQQYSLAQTSAQFELEVRNAGGPSPTVQLVLRQTLDREQVSSYQVYVVAYDGERQSGTLVVEIEVTDGNDHAPYFPNSTYTINVPENMAVNSTLMALRAIDGDTGVFGELSYSLNLNPEDKLARKFSIDVDSGNLILRQPLDYEEDQSFELPVSATDAGINTQPALATVMVKVMDINDNAPEIKINILKKDTDTAKISESSKNGSFVAHVSVSDKDAGDNGQFTCSVDNHHFKLQKIQKTQYMIVLATEIDREKQKEHQLTVTCLDHGRSPQTSSETLSVSVQDENDNSPIFTQEVYKAEISENDQINLSVLQVEATDKDSADSPNSQVRYGLQAEAKRYFSIDPMNGEIKAVAVFDFEKTEEIVFGVIAYDQGQPARTSTAMVEVQILDVNDHAPEFMKQNYMFDTLEGQPIGTQIGNVIAIDKDSKLYNEVEYSIYPGSAATIFDIDPESGGISTRANLDRESRGIFYFTVIAKNMDQTTPRSGTAMVTVTVLDDNDNAPVIEYPGPSNHTVNISNQVPVGYEVAIIDAYDLDDGENAKLSYTITGGNEKNAFVIKQDTGLVSTNSRLEQMDKEVFDLQIAVSDHGSPQEISSAVLHIRVDSSVPYAGESGQFLSGPNLTIVISLSVVCGIIVIILLVAICIMRNQEQRKRGQAYRSRRQALQVFVDKRNPQSRTSNGDINKNIANGDKNHSNGNIKHGDEISKLNKKEVTFSMIGEGSKPSPNNHPSDSVDSNTTGQRQSWPSSTCHSTHVNAARSNSVRMVDPPRVPSSFVGQNPKGSGARSVSPDQPHPSGILDSTSQKLYDLSVRHLQSQQWFDEVKADRDADSSCSNVSNTDSGRGPSEEGENLNHSNASNSATPGTSGQNGGRKLLHLQEVALNSRRDPRHRGPADHQPRGPAHRKPAGYPQILTDFKSYQSATRALDSIQGRSSKAGPALLSKDSIYSVPNAYDNPAFSRSMSQRGHRDNLHMNRQLRPDGVSAGYRNSCRGGLAPVHPAIYDINNPYVRRDKSGILERPMQRSSGTSDGSSSHRDSSGSTTSGSYVVDPSDFGLQESEVADFSAVVV